MIPQRIPDRFFRDPAIRRKLECGHAEFSLLLTILNETCRPGALEWMPIGDLTLAGWCGFTTASIHDFRQRLAAKGLIEVRLLTSEMAEYRACAASLSEPARDSREGVAA